MTRSMISISMPVTGWTSSALHVDPADLHIARDGADTLITFSDDANVLLIGVDADTISADSFTY